MTGKTTIFTYEIVGVRPNGFSHFCSPNGRIDGRNESYALSHTMRSFGFFIMDVTPVELIGQKFNKLTITELLPKEKDKPRRCIAVCECGKVKGYQVKHVKFGRTVSCGCIYGKSRIIHGWAHTRLDNVLKNMKNRCYNQKSEEFPNYGQRGIKICDEWIKSSKNFFDWALENGYSDDLQIDRIDNNSDYEPKNCRFVTSKENGNNKRNNVFATINGVTKTVSQWCEGDVVNKDASNVASRLKMGWSIEDALSRPIANRKRLITYNGETKSIMEWAKKTNVGPYAIYKRLELGWNIERAIETPVKRKA